MFGLGFTSIKGYVADFWQFLQEGAFPEWEGLVRDFVTGMEIPEDKRVLA